MFRFTSPLRKESNSFRTLSQNSHIKLNNISTLSNRLDYESTKFIKNEEIRKYVRIYSAVSKKTINKLKHNVISETNIKNPFLKPKNLKYLPKREIIKNNKNFFNKTSSINYLYQKDDNEKINNTETKIILNKEFKTDLKEEMNKHSNSDLIKFRTEYILKYAKISDFFQHVLKIYKEIINNDRKNYFGIYFSNERNIYENLNRLILEEIQSDVPLEYLTWKNLLSLFYDFTFEYTNILNFLFEEIKIIQNKNIHLENKLFEKENDLENNLGELEKVNEYIIEKDLNRRKKEDKKKEQDINKIKLKARKKENAYIITIYRLEEEIRQLTELLNKNKIQQNELNIVKNEKNDKIKEIDNLRNKFNKEINDLSIKITCLKEQIEELKYQIKELENENNNLKEEIDNKNHQITSLGKDKEDIIDMIKIKDKKIKSLQEILNSYENNDKNKSNDEIDLINVPVFTVMTTSHNV
jgi:hypothetical protein